MKDSSRSRIRSVPTACLSWKTQPGPDRFDDRRGASLLAVGRIADVAVLVLVHIGHRAAARRAGTRLVSRPFLTASTPGVPGPPMNLCGGQENRVLAVDGAVRSRSARRHADFDIGGGRRVVPERQRAVAVQQGGDGPGVGGDAGDVGGGREAADLERPVGMVLEGRSQAADIDMAVGVGVDDDDVGDGFAPRQFVWNGARRGR